MEGYGQRVQYSVFECEQNSHQSGVKSAPHFPFWQVGKIY
ncbi:MAG: CRISPR-associated endonuclease Cas2 [Cuspidothrix sp.]